MASVIGRYNYLHGAGQEANRQLQFLRTTNSSANTIQARVYVLQSGNVNGAPFSSVSGERIVVELENLASQMRARIQNIQLRPNVLLSDLSVEQQDNIMGTLSNRKIDVNLQFGSVENVQSLMIRAEP